VLLLLLPLLQGYAPGFPVLLPLQLSQARSAAAMQYLLDGNYLDKQSAGLSAALLVYNADLRILGLARLHLQWRSDGSFTGEQQWLCDICNTICCCMLSRNALLCCVPASCCAVHGAAGFVIVHVQPS
jgi:hypothetical protein